MQGHYVMPFTDGEALAKSLTAEKPNDCFDMKTQILTDKGWKFHNEITKESLIANWIESTGIITYSKPIAIINRNHDGNMVRVFNDRLDIKVTPNHIIIVFNEDNNSYISMEAKDLKSYVANNPNSYIPANGYSALNIKDSLNIDYSKLIISNEKSSGMLFQSYDKNTITGIVTNQRLSGSSSLILEKQGSLGIIYQTLVGKSPLNIKGFKLTYDAISTIQVNEPVWCVTVPTNRVLAKRNNSIYVIGNCHSLNAIRLWGTTDKRTEAKSFSYACVPSDNTEVLTLEGWKYKKDLSTTDIVYSYNAEHDSIEVDVVRGIVTFNDKPIVVISNGIDSFESTSDHRWYGLKHKNDLEYSFFITDEITPDTVILNSLEDDSIVESTGYQVINVLPPRETFCITTNNSTFLIRQNKKYTTITGNCMYGAQPAKLAKMLRITLEEAEKLYESYWEGVPALKELKERLENYWRNTNKSFIKSIDGRKLYVRKQHALVNLLLQSGGALVVKYTLIGVAKRLSDLGLLGNPLTDTPEESANKIYQLIIYHDECQYDCPKSIFEFSDYYEDENDAKKAAKEFSGSSAVSHNENGYYFVKSNLLSEIIEEEMFKVCFDLELKVPLSMEYNVGRNWAECH